MREPHYGAPLLVPQLSSVSAQALTPIRFEKHAGATYSENWLQTLISRYPNALPIDLIEPTFTPVVSVCMEMPLPSGFVDNLYITPEGDLILGEAKLFRNPEARREVIGQIIDYAKDLSGMTYESLNEAIKRAQLPDGSSGKQTADLYALTAAAAPDDIVEEASFIDAVTRNLRKGRFLLLVIGDGIQESMEQIAAFLQQHAGMHFTLGLVELRVFALPVEQGGYLVLPRVLMRTRNIDRGIVTIEQDRITVKAPEGQKIASYGIGKAISISEEKFYEGLAQHYPDCVEPLKSFIAELEPLGVYLEFGKESMILRWWSDEKRKWNLATILISGKVWTEMLNQTADNVGLIHLSHAYLERLANMVAGASVRKTPNPKSWYVSKGGSYITIDELLRHKDQWQAAMQAFMQEAHAALDNR